MRFSIIFPILVFVSAAMVAVVVMTSCGHDYALRNACLMTVPVALLIGLPCAYAFGAWVDRFNAAHDAHVASVVDALSRREIA